MDTNKLIQAPIAQHLRGFWPESAAPGQLVVRGRRLAGLAEQLVPFALLDAAERAVLEDPDLYRQTRQGLEDFTAGNGVSSDWLFADDE